MKKVFKRFTGNRAKGILFLNKPIGIFVLMVILMDVCFLFMLCFWAEKALADPGGPPPRPLAWGMSEGGAPPFFLPGPEGRPAPGAFPGMMPPFPPVDRLLGRLDLTEQQRDRVREIQDQLHKTLIRKRAEEQVSALELKQLLDRDPINLKEVESQLLQMAALKVEMQLAPVKAFEMVKQELTPEQRKKWRALVAQRPPLEPGPGRKRPASVED